MQPIAPINNAYTQYQYMQQNQYQQNHKQKQDVDINEDNDTFEHSSYSPYSMYDNKGNLYNNCIARRIVNMDC